jgi:hypothetical protein
VNSANQEREAAADREQEEKAALLQKTADYVGGLVVEHDMYRRNLFINTVHGRFRQKITPFASGMRVLRRYVPPRAAWSETHSTASATGRSFDTETIAHPAVTARAQGVMFNAEGKLIAYDVHPVREPVEANNTVWITAQESPEPQIKSYEPNDAGGLTTYLVLGGLMDALERNFVKQDGVHVPRFRQAP